MEVLIGPAMLLGEAGLLFTILFVSGGIMRLGGGAALTTQFIAGVALFFRRNYRQRHALHRVSTLMNGLAVISGAAVGASAARSRQHGTGRPSKHRPAHAVPADH